MSNYQVEIDMFKKNLSFLREKKIILYGIGRKTATLIPEITDWKIAGLMDRDPENVGKVIYNIEIVDLSYAEKNADAIVINAPQMYWQVIYNRIRSSKIPVYYLDGSLAVCKDNNYKYNDWWEEDSNKLKKLIDENDIISFDLYDTLIMRKVYLPQDVWIILQKKINSENIKLNNFQEIRKQAINEVKKPNPCLMDIYDKIKEITGLDDTVINYIYSLELQLEEEVAIGRKAVIDLFSYATNMDKEVYIVTDMHLPMDVIKKLLHNVGLNVEDDNIYLSCERGGSKRDGLLWKDFIENTGNGKHLHIGDDVVGDIEKAKEYGITTYKIKSPVELFEASAVGNFASQITTEYSSIIMGLINSELINNPYSLNKTRGKVVFDKPEKIGFGLFGPVIYTLLKWICQECKRRGFTDIYFLARDGYFLYKDIKYLNEFKDNSICFRYLESSRRACMVANICDTESLLDVIKFPYNGFFKDFLMDRFSILADNRTDYCNNKIISSVNDFEYVKSAVFLYLSEIYIEAEKEKKAYLSYLEKMKFDKNSVVVDLFFYGNTQYYLSKLINARLTGFYIACDISSQNRTVQSNELVPCFQEYEDCHAEKCEILKMCLLIESFLTAPNGMLLKIDEEGKFVYSKPGKNQETFTWREKINDGVIKFIEEAERLMCGIPLDQYFIDKYYGNMIRDGMVISEELKEIFYFDNALIQRRELKILE